MTIFKNKTYYGYYKKNKKDIIELVLVFIIAIILFCLLQLFWDVKPNKDIYVSMIVLVSSIYYFLLNKRMEKERAKDTFCNVHSAKCVKMFRFYVLSLLVFSIVIMILSIVMNLNSYLYLILLIYIFLIGMGLMNFSLVIFFGEDFYYSSGFKVYYREIDKIVQEGQVNTLDGILVLCRLEKNEKVIGYEKLMLTDYAYLNNKIESKLQI